jgi:hypothetical protein
MKDGDIKRACEHMALILHLLANRTDVFRALQVPSPPPPPPLRPLPRAAPSPAAPAV